MLDPRGAPALRPDTDDVEAQLSTVPRVRGQPGGRRGAQPTDPGRVHGVDRLAEPAGAPRLHLAEDDDLRVAGHDVQLALGTAPVAVEYLHADQRERALGDPLTVGADRVR